MKRALYKVVTNGADNLFITSQFINKTQRYEDIRCSVFSGIGYAYLGYVDI